VKNIILVAYFQITVIFFLTVISYFISLLTVISQFPSLQLFPRKLANFFKHDKLMLVLLQFSGQSIIVQNLY